MSKDVFMVLKRTTFLYNAFCNIVYLIQYMYTHLASSWLSCSSMCHWSCGYSKKPARHKHNVVRGHEN